VNLSHEISYQFCAHIGIAPPNRSIPLVNVYNQFFGDSGLLARLCHLERMPFSAGRPKRVAQLLQNECSDKDDLMWASESDLFINHPQGVVCYTQLVKSQFENGSTLEALCSSSNSLLQRIMAPCCEHSPSCRVFSL
jgi:hypothetical protein